MNNHFIRLTSTKFVVFSKSFCHGNNVTFSFSTKRSHFIFESFISIISTLRIQQVCGRESSAFRFLYRVKYFTMVDASCVMNVDTRPVFQ